MLIARSIALRKLPASAHCATARCLRRCGVRSSCTILPRGALARLLSVKVDQSFCNISLHFLSHALVKGSLPLDVNNMVGRRNTRLCATISSSGVCLAWSASDKTFSKVLRTIGRSLRGIFAIELGSIASTPILFGSTFNRLVSPSIPLRRRKGSRSSSEFSVVTETSEVG